MKKFFTLFLVVIIASLSACGGNNDEATQRDQEELNQELEREMERELETVVAEDDRLSRNGLEIRNIDGEDVFYFTDTRSISVVAWNRADVRLPHISQSRWADWIKAEVLRMHNIDVTFVEVPRWEEVETIANLLATQAAPDVSFTFEYPPVESLALMGGILDLAPLMIEYADLVPNFYTLQSADNIWWNRKPETGSLWAFAVRHYDNTLRMGTFVRGDWLETLGIAPPTSHAEFEAMLYAFRDNAELLLGADANQMIPYRLTQDVGWTGDPVLTSFIPNDITDREYWTRDFDDRRFMQPGIKEGARLLNKWYNDGLLWNDFSLYEPNDSTGDDLMIMGFVGAFSGNWDYPFRPRPGIIVELQKQIPGAYFIPVAPFENDAGIVRMQVPHGTDRSIFFPHTNTEPIASLLYLDFISRIPTYEFLMFGYEGIHHVIEDGVYRAIPVDDIEDDSMVIPSLRNYDLLPTFNGVPPLNTHGFTVLFKAFDGVDPEIIARSVELGSAHAWVNPRAVTRRIESESRGGGLQGRDGMSNGILNRAINASLADFDSVFDAGYDEYMASGGSAIIAERDAAWVETFGDVQWLPVPEDE